MLPRNSLLCQHFEPYILSQFASLVLPDTYKDPQHPHFFKMETELSFESAVTNIDADFFHVDKDSIADAFNADGPQM